MHVLTGVEQQITLAHNSLVESQNWKMKNALDKILDEIPCQWYETSERVLLHIPWVDSFQRTIHCFLMHNQDPVLPIDAKSNLSNLKPGDNNEPFDIDTFNVVIVPRNITRQQIHEWKRCVYDKD